MPIDPKLASLVGRIRRLSAELNATLQEYETHHQQALTLIGEILGVDMPTEPPPRARVHSDFRSKLN